MDIKIKKVLVEVSKGLRPSNYSLSKDEKCIFWVNVFYGGGRYFFFYSGLFKRRRLKRNTWLLELILNRDRLKCKMLGKDYVAKPLKILEGVEKGDYNYKKMYVSAYLMRRLLEGSTRPETFIELDEN